MRTLFSFAFLYLGPIKSDSGQPHRFLNRVKAKNNDIESHILVWFHYKTVFAFECVICIYLQSTPNLLLPFSHADQMRRQSTIYFFDRLEMNNVI